MILIVQFRNVLKMVMFFSHPTERNYVVNKDKDLEAMQFRRNLLKNVLHHARKETFCVNKRSMLTSRVEAVIQKIPCYFKML